MTRYLAYVTAVLAIPSAFAGAATGWTRFQDPFERAFTMDVPQGWSVKGGMFRLGYSDQRPMVDLRSADGRINLRFGDVAIPSYSLPGRFHSREGEVYDLGAQAQMTVAAYRSGQDFARLYARSRFLGQCKSLTVEDTQAPLGVQDHFSESAGLVKSSVGEITYRCQTTEGVRIVYAYARTALYNGLWQVPAIASFSAPPEQVQIVRSIARRCSESLQVSEEWMRYQQRMDQEGLTYQRLRQEARIRELGQQVRQFEARMASMRDQVRSFERRQDAQAAQVRGFGDILTGITPTVDPLTGEFRQVWTGSKSGYWTNGRGDIVNSASAPAGGGWHALQTLQ